MDPDTLRQLALALGIGLLIGIQRERSESPVAGIRTFPLVSLSGAVSALIARATTPAVLAAAILAFGAIVVVGHLRLGEESRGLTTEVAVLLMFLCGAALVWLPLSVGVAVAGVAAILLHLKRPMHRFVRQLGEEDVRAIMRFAVITFVVLPILPNTGLGPYQVLNPFSIWLMVVLIVSINLVGYVALRLYGHGSGSVLGGILGGLVSSTATTVSACRRRGQPGAALAAIIVIATGVMYVRVFIEVAAVHPTGALTLGAPFLGLAAAFFAYGLLEARSLARGDGDGPAGENPAELRAALFFGLLYGVVLVVVAWAEDSFGGRGVVAVSGLAGLTNVDALTLTNAHLAGLGKISRSLAFRAILVGTLTNLAFKFCLVLVLGPRDLARRLLSPFLLCGYLLGGALFLAYR